MKITQAGEYGLLALVYLARQPEGRLAMSDEIATAEDIPKGFLAKILQTLNRAGFLYSRQGAKGGFMLARRPVEISVLEVIEAIEGPIAFQRCLEEPATCDRAETCALCAVFTEAQNQVTEIFARVTLSDLLQPRDKVLRKARRPRRAGVPA